MTSRAAPPKVNVNVPTSSFWSVSTTYAVTITRTAGFSGAVALTVSGLPSGGTGTFNPSSVTGTSSTLTVNAQGNASRTTVTLRITGASGTITATTTVTLTIR